MRVRAKICGLCRPEDARAACEAGADYLGVVFATSPRGQSREAARAIWTDLDATRVGVFLDPDESEVLELARDLSLGVVQLHGSEEPDLCRRIARAGEWSVWKAVQLEGSDRLPQAVERYAGAVDALLLEGMSEHGRGGVGARFDWSVVVPLRETWPTGLGLVLAGGLDPTNVGEAIATVRPDVVDVSSGIEREVGRKDPVALQAFLNAVEQANRR